MKREERHLLPTQAAIALAIASGALATTLGGSQLKQVLDGVVTGDVDASTLESALEALKESLALVGGSASTAVGTKRAA